MFGGDIEENPNLIAMLAVAILAPIAAGVVQMAVSGSHQFQSDGGAAELPGCGDSLADALGRIEVLAHRTPMPVMPAQTWTVIHNPLAEPSTRSRPANMAI
jgi:heat shock protein HtpX